MVACGQLQKHQIRELFIKKKWIIISISTQFFLGLKAIGIPEKNRTSLC